ncbi:hypothetical protein [Gordonia tangerina]|jgi:type II secretory pathway pseudopilin PulG|uniref:Uncharacterized protein n=1 Tax=Gordonia tangerina TaxID=2911060 RepID=A0ABS9DHR9_9ACTN|nr:hypothetical protein [Gordonia tangerina]MCF3938687.1 hypothetical protein [Gordonia tangerina]
MQETFAMLITIIIVGAIVAVLVYFFQPSIDFARYEQRQVIAARERTQRRVERRERRVAAAAARASAPPSRSQAHRRSHAWVFDFATQLRSFI